MYRVMSMILVMAATALMGLAFSWYAISRAGEPLDVVDAHYRTQAYLEQARDERTSQPTADEKLSD